MDDETIQDILPISGEEIQCLASEMLTSMSGQQFSRPAPEICRTRNRKGCQQHKPLKSWAAETNLSVRDFA